MLRENHSEFIDTKLNEIATETTEVLKVTLEEVERTLKIRNNKEAPGPGDLPAELFKHTATAKLNIIMRHNISYGYIKSI